MTPHTAGVASCTARIRRAGVPCSRKPRSRKARLTMLRLSAFSGSPACRSSGPDTCRRARTISHVEHRRMFEPLARSRFRDWRRRFDLRLSEIDPEVARRPAAPGGRRGQPHHGVDDHDLDDDRREALPEKDRVAERNDAAGDHAAVRRRCRGSAAAARRVWPSAARPIRSGPAPRRCRARGSWRRRARDSRRPRPAARSRSRARR